VINESRGDLWAGLHSLCFAIICYCPSHGGSLAPEVKTPQGWMNGWVEGCAEGRRILNLAGLGLSSRRSESLEAVIGGGVLGCFVFGFGLVWFRIPGEIWSDGL